MFGKGITGKRSLLLILLAVCVLAATGVHAQWGRVGSSPQEDCRSITFVRLDSSTVIALSGQKRFGVFYSRTFNNGATWSNWAPTWLDEFALNYEVIGPTGNVTYETAVVNTVTSVGNTVVAGTSNGLVFYSSDAAGDYSSPWSLSTGIPLGSGVMDLSVTQTGQILACVYGTGIYISSDQGASFSLYAGTGGAGTGNFMAVAPHADFGAFGYMWAVTDKGNVLSGGVYFWNGSNWLDLSATLPIGLHALSSVLISNEPADPEYIWIGDLSGGLYRSDDLGANWTEMGDICDPVLSLALAPDYNPTNGHVLIGTGYGLQHLLFGAVNEIYPKGIGINSIEDDPAHNGTAWLATTSGIKKVVPGQSYPGDVQRDSFALFDISTIATSPAYMADHVTFGLSERLGLFMSRDGGVSFQMYMPPLEQSQTTNLGFEIVGFGPSPVYSGNNGACNQEESTVYLATKGRGIYKSANGGSSWVQINGGLSSNELDICRFAVTPNVAPYPLFAARCGFATILRFNGSSSTWSPTTLPLPNSNEVNVIEFCPTFPSPPVVYVGTDKGLYISTDGGASFFFDASIPPTPPTYAPVTSVAFHPGFNNAEEQTVFVARGGSIYRRTWVVTHWEWVNVSGAFPGAFVSQLAVSPLFATDQTVVAAYGQQSGSFDNGVWLSQNRGASWSLINGTYPNDLRDRFVKAMKFVQSPIGVRLLVGTRKERALYSDSSDYSYWNPSTGWETSPTCVNALAVSPVPTPTTCGPLSTSGSDIFLGTCKGVFWSNDGGETFRPINEGLVDTVANSGCVPIEVTALHVETTLSATGFAEAGTIQPVLIAGTKNKGIWYRNATETINGWDWASGVWTQSNVNSGSVNKFSRETDLVSSVSLQKVVRAATTSGAYMSTGPTGTLGVVWTPMPGLSGNVTAICHGNNGAGFKDGRLPEAPQSGTIWGTTWGTGVKKGTETSSFGERTETVTWETRNGTGSGTLGDLNQQAIIQLTNGNVLSGAGASLGTGTGVWRSSDEGLTTWYQSNGGLGSTTMNVREFLEVESNLDVFCAVEGTTSDGGIFISADKGVNWVSISSGFDPESQALADIVQTSGDPPVYYAGTFSRGTYATTITPADPPTVSSISVSSGGSAGGDTVTITGTNFQCSCPSNYTCLSGRDKAVASFGGIDGTTTSCSSTEIVVTTPQHPTGKVAVKVRNPDTRVSTSSQEFTFTDESSVEIKLSRDGSNNIVVSWEGSGSPTKVYRSPNKDFTGWVKSDTITSSPYTYSDASGTDSLVYYYTIE